MRSILGLALLAASAALAPASAEDATVKKAIEGFVRPGYAAFVQTSETMRMEMAALCEAPSQAALDAARTAFGADVVAWSRVELLRFGPVTEDNRLDRILYWPDRKSIGLKQVQRAIAEQDATATDAAALAGKSVAMQGLGALEYVLFGTDSDGLSGAEGAYRCAYGRAVATNLSTIASVVDAEWAAADGFAALWQDPGPDNALYRTDKEALTELVDVFIHGLEQIRDVRLKGFLGADAKSDKPKQAIFWRSGSTIASIEANADSLHDLLVASDLKNAMSEDNRWIAGSITAQFSNAAQVLDAAGGPVGASLATPELRARLVYFQSITTSLSSGFAMRVAPDLGLSAGFSSLDGD